MTHCLVRYVEMLTPSDWPTIPQVYLKGEFVGGADIMYSSESRAMVQDAC